jgi:starch synthase
MALVDAVEQAVSLFADATQWRELVQRAMQQDFSWDRSATQYLTLYRQVTAQRFEPSLPRISASG